MLQYWKGMVRVGSGVAMSREMLGDRHNARILQSSRKGIRFFRHIDPVVAKCPEVDDRIGRVCVDVGHWGEIHVESHGSHLFSNTFPDLVDCLRPLDGTQRLCIGEGKEAVDPECRPCFTINGQ